VIAGLYLPQALVAGFAVLIMLPGFAQAGIDLEAQAPLLAAGAIPWVVKLVWAGLIDTASRTRPRRIRGFIAGGQLVAALGMYMLAGSFGAVLRAEVLPSTLAAWWLVTNAGLALQDAGTDALALDAVAVRDRAKAGLAMQVGHGLGQGVLVAGLYLHLMVGVVAPWGLPALCRLTAAVLVGTAWLGLAFPGVPEQRAPRPVGPALRELVATPRVYVAVVAAVLVGMPDALTSVVAPEFLTAELAWDFTKLVRMLRVGAFVGVAVTFGLLPLADRLGRLTLAVTGATMVGLAYIVFAFATPLWSHDATFYALAAAESIGRGLLLAGVWALLMDLTHPAFRAIQFTLWVSLTNVGRVLAPAIAPDVVAAGGYGALWLLAGLLSLAVVPLLWWVGRGGVASFTRSPEDSDATADAVDNPAATP